MSYFVVTWLNIINLFTLSVLLSLSIYHFVIYMGRRSYKLEEANLFFAIFAFSYFVILLLNTYFPMIPAFEDIQSKVFAPFLELTIAFVSSFFCTLFILRSFGIEKSSSKYLVPGIVFFALSGMVTLIRFFVSSQVYSDRFYQPAVILVAIGIFLLLGGAVFQIVKLRIPWKSSRLLVFLGLAIIVVENLMERILWTLGYAQNWNSYFLSAFAMFLFSFSLARKFNQEYYQLDRLKKKLHQEVRDKTAELQTAMDRLKAMDKEKTTFYLRAAHETKTPLTLVKNYLEKMMKTQGNSKEFQIIHRNLDSLIYDMNQLMDMEKFQENRTLFNHDQYCDIHQQIEQLKPLFIERAKKKTIELKFQLTSSCWVQADPSSINRILFNLFDNAYKNSNKESTILFYLHKEQDKVQLKVQDHGRGIPDKDQESIFKLFSQAQVESQSQQGIGMGLFVIKQIVDSLEGNITLESSLGIGSAFTVELKAVQGTKAIGESPEIEIHGASQWSVAQAAILVVEDNQDLRDFLVEEFSSLCEVHSAGNGAEALEILERETPDLIISDIMMPEMDGLELFTHVLEREEHRSIPFLFLTARNSNQEKIDQLNRGAVDYISKPFSIDEVIAKAGSLIRFSHEKQDAVMNETVLALQSIVKGKKKSGQNDQSQFEARLKAEGVTPRQQEIILLIAQGQEYKEIAYSLDLSPKTINRHMQILYKKYQVNNKIELLNYFQSGGA